VAFYLLLIEKLSFNKIAEILQYFHRLLYSVNEGGRYQMKYRKLGRTGLKVSEISLGSWLTYGNSTEKETAIRTIDKAYELGIKSHHHIL
jgi:hypothetical protein